MNLRSSLRLACVASLLAAGPAAALETQLHGFVTQGALVSEGNELFGTSTEGSIEYSEHGLNAAADFGYGLRASGQFLTRRAGDNDDGKPRLDFGFVDYRPLRSVAANAGLRAGRIKTFWGLYNDSRDVVFTRPGILLPDSMYSDISGQRAVLFSSDGAQLYGDVGWGDQLISLVVAGSRDRDLNDLEKSKLLDLGGAPFDAQLQDYWQARLLDEIDGGRWRFALSFLQADFAVDAPSILTTAKADAWQLGASMQYNAERFSITGEYVHNQNASDAYFNGALVQHVDSFFNGGYVQGQYRFTAQWAALARFDAMFSRDNGQDCDERSPPQDDHECFSLDTTVGGSWQPDPHWGVWAEWHLLDGTFNRVSKPDNPGGVYDPHWNVFLLMAAYRF
jgi:hypothetical protein